MRKLVFVLPLVAAATLLRPVAASAHRVVLGGPSVVTVAPPCGNAFHPGFVAPGYYAYPGPDFRVYDPSWYYRWNYGQYFSHRSERIYGFTLPGRR